MYLWFFLGTNGLGAHLVDSRLLSLFRAYLCGLGKTPVKCELDRVWTTKAFFPSAGNYECEDKTPTLKKTTGAFFVGSKKNIGKIKDTSWQTPISMLYLKHNKQQRKVKIMMTKEEIKQAVAHYTKEQLIELVAELTISEQEKREELDKIQGIIR